VVEERLGFGCEKRGASIFERERCARLSCSPAGVGGRSALGEM